MLRLLTLLALFISSPVSAQLLIEYQFDANTTAQSGYSNPITNHSGTFVLSDDEGAVSLQAVNYTGFTSYNLANSDFEQRSDGTYVVGGLAGGGADLLSIFNPDYVVTLDYFDGSATGNNFIYTGSDGTVFGIDNSVQLTEINRLGYVSAEKQAFLDEAQAYSVARANLNLASYLLTFSGATRDALGAVFDGVVSNITNAITLNESAINVIVATAITLIVAPLTAYYLGIGGGLAAASVGIATAGALLLADAYYFGQETIARRNAADPPDYTYGEVYEFSGVTELPDLGILPEDQAFLDAMFADVIAALEAGQGELVSLERAQGALLDGDREALELQKAAMAMFSSMQPELESAALAHVESVEVPAVPEPSTWMMMLLGFFGIGALLRRRQSQIKSWDWTAPAST